MFEKQQRIIDPYLEEEDLYLDEGTMANQLAFAIDTIIWAPQVGHTIWSDECQSCADWLYQNIDGADAIIDSLNELSCAGRPNFVDFPDDDWDPYGDLADKLIEHCVPDEEGMRELDEVPAIGSVFDCEGPVLDAMERFKYNRAW